MKKATERNISRFLISGLLKKLIIFIFLQSLNLSQVLYLSNHENKKHINTFVLIMFFNGIK